MASFDDYRRRGGDMIFVNLHLADGNDVAAFQRRSHLFRIAGRRMIVEGRFAPLAAIGGYQGGAI
jgi:hypothetical protein